MRGLCRNLESASRTTYIKQDMAVNFTFTVATTPTYSLHGSPRALDTFMDVTSGTLLLVVVVARSLTLTVIKVLVPVPHVWIHSG